MKNSLLLLLFISCLSCTNNKKSASVSSITDTIASASVDVETTDTSDEIYEKPLTFSELVAKVPITPLPFGISGIDTLNIYQPLSDHSLPPYGYDTLNVYKLNIEELRLPNDPNPVYSEEFHVRDSYFSKRLPPLPTGEEVLLYYRKIHVDTYWVIVCSQKGRILSEFGIFDSRSNYSLSLINENYKIIERIYDTPYGIGDIHREGFKHLKDEVSEDVTNKNLTVLHFAYEYKISSKEIKEINSKSYYWRKGIPTLISESINDKFIKYPPIEDDSIAIDLPDSLLATTTDSIKLQEVILEEEVKDTMQVEIE
ncbi:hypothetical protein [Bacteroides sp. 224]|uniref:hypothetical protein n=1 Tax=Bacteroides sp. 224 TaxID=2302936 RepID=UPI0013D0F722|nr:hypothetical protein [Bacteroides sp. 224]NDV65327.1 hypothetical protein [Bacteroides sp. 224]